MVGRLCLLWCRVRLDLAQLVESGQAEHGVVADPAVDARASALGQHLHGLGDLRDEFTAAGGGIARACVEADVGLGADANVVTGARGMFGDGEGLFFGAFGGLSRSLPNRSGASR